MNADNANMLLALHRERPARGATHVSWLFRLLILGMVAVAWIIGGPLVRACAVSAGIFALLGELDGAWRHICRIGAFSGVLFLVYANAPRVAPQISAVAGIGHTASIAAAGFAALLIAWILFLIGMRASTRFLQARPRLKLCNQLLGGSLGAMEGVLFVVVGLWALDAFGGSLEILNRVNAGREHSPAAMWVKSVTDAADHLRTDTTYGLLARSNPIAESPMIRQTASAIEALSSLENLEKFGSDERVQAFVQDPMVQEKLKIFQEDEGVRSALQRRDIGALLSHPSIQAMVSDGEFQDKLVTSMPGLWSALGESKHSNTPASMHSRLAAPRRIVVEDLAETPLSREREADAHRALQRMLDKER